MVREREIIMQGTTVYGQMQIEKGGGATCTCTLLGKSAKLEPLHPAYGTLVEKGSLNKKKKLTMKTRQEISEPLIPENFNILV